MSRARSRRAAKPARLLSRPTPFAEGYRMPAEWEPHAATWLAWPHEESDWPGKFAVIPWTFVELTRLIVRSERVRLIVRGPAEQRRAKALFKGSGIDLGRVDFVHARTDRSWTRDFVPSFVVRTGRATREAPRVAAVGWRFDGWKRYPNHEHDARAGRTAAGFVDAHVFEPVVTLG
ncbi:MAG TPA: agmatine deiminase family protein, partial [Polyangiaceae bacterium]